MGLSDETIETKARILNIMLKNNVNIDDPEQVKLFIAQRKTWCPARKQLAVFTYTTYAKLFKIEWTPPKYDTASPIPFVPTEKEIDALISGTTKRISTVLQTLKETGFRIGELWKCKWTDLDPEGSTLKCLPEKHSHPREAKISQRLLSIIQTLPKTSTYIFQKGKLRSLRWNFIQQRRRLAEQLQNPRLSQIHFHTFRHFHATKLFSETKSLLLVKERLGHKSIISTMVYTHIVEFDEESQNYHHAVAKDEKEAGQLIDNGWTYILTTPQNVMMFRKRK